jgi:hypothetical protein
MKCKRLRSEVTYFNDVAFVYVATETPGAASSILLARLANLASSCLI